MQKGRGGMGNHKHGKSGCRNGNGKSPKLREQEKREAEKNVRQDKSKISNPKNSIEELFK